MDVPVLFVGLGEKLTDLPLAQYPHFNLGLPLQVAEQALATACGQPDVCAIVITELNPDNDASGAYVRRLVTSLVAALGRLAEGG